MVDSMKGLDEYVDMEVIRHRSLSSDRGFHCIPQNPSESVNRTERASSKTSIRQFPITK